MQRTVQNKVIEKSINYINELNFSQLYSQRLAGLSEELILNKIKDVDPKVYSSLIQKNEKLESTIVECNALGNEIIALSSELERLDSLLQVVSSINIDDI